MAVQMSVRKTQGGVTMLEIVVALMIIMVALSATASMWLMQSRAGQSVTQLSQALDIGVNCLEASFRNLPFDSQAATSGTDPVTGMSYALSIVPITATRHGCRLDVTQPGNPTPLLSLYAVSAK